MKKAEIIFIPHRDQYFQTLHRNDVLKGSSRVPAPRPNLHRDYSKSLTLSNLGEPSKVEFLRTIPKFRNKGKFRRCLCTSWNWAFSRRSRAVSAKKWAKKTVMHVENCCFRLIPSFRLLSSDVKVPNVVLMFRHCTLERPLNINCFSTERGYSIDLTHSRHRDYQSLFGKKACAQQKAKFSSTAEDLQVWTSPKVFTIGRFKRLLTTATATGYG